MQDRTLSLAARAAFANRHRADLFLSIHANAAAAPEVEGIEIYHFPGSVPGRWLALHVLDRLLERLPGHRSRGVKEANFAVLRLTRMPSILVECEFLTHPGQRRWLLDPGEQTALAGAIADGVAGASGLPYQKLLAEAPSGSRGSRGRPKAAGSANEPHDSTS
jgi:N-acetylmuramoyl-L-alanine amidase